MSTSASARTRQPRTAAQAREGSSSRRQERRCRSARSPAGRALGRWRHATAQLADAQLAVAREAGFDSWPKLVEHLQERDISAFRDAVSHGDVATRDATPRITARQGTGQRSDVRVRPAGRTHRCEERADAETLIAAGADVNLKSEWENGPYTVLDNADEDTARFLLARGATLTPNVAADSVGSTSFAAACREFARSCTRAEETGSSRSTRRRPSRSPTCCSTTALMSTCAASITSPRRRSTRSSIDPTSVVDCSNAAPRRHLHGGSPRRCGACDTTARRRSTVDRRTHQRARLCTGAAVQHLLLDTRLRHVAARRRVTVRPSRRPRSAYAPQSDAGALHQRRPGRRMKQGARVYR